MTILIFDDITALAYYLERVVRSDEPGPPVTNVELACDYLADSCDGLAGAIKELDTSLRALVPDHAPQYGAHLPGLITPRIVDNAERSGANLLKRVNAVNVRDPPISQAPGTQPVNTGGIFLSVPLFTTSVPFYHPFVPKNAHFVPLPGTFLHFWKTPFFPVGLFSEHKTRAHNMESQQLPALAENITTSKVKGGNPFASGFVPNGKRKKKSQSYLTKRSLLKYMLEVDLSIQDLPQRMADDLRNLLPGWFENVEKRFTMRQIMELVQFQLLFSKSDYVRQDAINAIKDRVDGKAVQRILMDDPAENEATEILLPNGRKIAI